MELTADQLRYKELVDGCGLNHEEALCAVGCRTGPAPDYVKLSRNEKQREIDRLKSQGLSAIEARRTVGLYCPEKPSQGVVLSPPGRGMSEKAWRKAKKRRKEFQKNYDATTRPEVRGLKGVLK